VEGAPVTFPSPVMAVTYLALPSNFIGKKVKQSCYRPGGAQRVPGS